MIKRSTNISLWISSLILEPTIPKARAKRFSKLIKIAEVKYILFFIIFIDIAFT